MYIMVIPLFFSGIALVHHTCLHCQHSHIDFFEIKHCDHNHNESEKNNECAASCCTSNSIGSNIADLFETCCIHEVILFNIDDAVISVYQSPLINYFLFLNNKSNLLFEDFFVEIYSLKIYNYYKSRSGPTIPIYIKNSVLLT